MLTNLEWLPAPPADFNERLRALRRDAASQAKGLDERAVSLATSALDENQLNKLSRLVNLLLEHGGPNLGLPRLKLGLVGDGTLSLLSPAIIGAGLRHGLLLEIVEGGYNSAVQEAVDRTSAVHAAGLDAVLIACDARLLGLSRAASSREEAEAKVEAAFQRIKLIADKLKGSVSTGFFIQTVAPPLEPLFGSFDRIEPGSPFAMVEELNRRIAAWVSENGLVLVDIARLAFSVGLEHWDDPRQWHASKLTFAPLMIPVYADVVTRTIAAMRGRMRKCLVLDLDNTLWGGVIGDDGLAGIKLGQGSASGEAFLAVQQMALELRARGIVLAVCSKNEEDVARRVFREHPDMLLREEHIAVFQVNWTDKAANLRAIAEALNIGVDALVFLDDNPAERMQVRGELPFVAVPELPDDPAFYPRMLAAAGYFDAVAFSDEDRRRADFYQANALRKAVLNSTADLGNYLASLEMTATIDLVDALSRPRVAQLINKSNQFNLTTRRYSESEVAAAERDPRRHVVQVRLTDRFGDNGIICVMIACKDRATWQIDTWLMSCRVLGRRVEEACLAHLVAAATAEGAREIVGRYVPSPKNRMVAGHYEKLGFSLSETLPDGVTVWRLDASGFRFPDLEMRVQDHYLSKRGKVA